MPPWSSERPTSSLWKTETRLLLGSVLSQTAPDDAYRFLNEPNYYPSQDELGNVLMLTRHAWSDEEIMYTMHERQFTSPISLTTNLATQYETMEEAVDALRQADLIIMGSQICWETSVSTPNVYRLQSLFEQQMDQQDDDEV